MDESKDTERSRGGRILDGAAGTVGQALFGIGWTCGRIAPKVGRAVDSLAGTKVVQFTTANLKRGYEAGYERCLDKEDEAEVRKAVNQAVDMGIIGAKEVGDMLMEDLTKILRSLGFLKPRTQGA